MGNSWTVTLAAVASDRKGAQEILDKLKAYSPRGRLYVTEYLRPEDGVTFYRVRMGFFKNSAAAQAAGRELAEKANAYRDFWPEVPTQEEFRANGAKVVDFEPPAAVPAAQAQGGR
jgi:hypothetical protein